MQLVVPLYDRFSCSEALLLSVYKKGKWQAQPL
jgi:hypothetical protein